jgi:hypothetical protein
MCQLGERPRPEPEGDGFGTKAFLLVAYALIAAAIGACFFMSIWDEEGKPARSAYNAYLAAIDRRDYDEALSYLYGRECAVNRERLQLLAEYFFPERLEGSVELRVMYADDDQALLDLTPGSSWGIYAMDYWRLVNPGEEIDVPMSQVMLKTDDGWKLGCD